MLNKFFEPERWQYALEKGACKGISKSDLRQLSDPSMRANLYLAIKSGKYKIAPPHTQLIPKDVPGEFRTVYINENVDRLFLSILNDLLFEEYAEWIHPQCKSYQKGIGCGNVVKELSKEICKSNGETIGFKADLSKYFDSVPIEVIDIVLDSMEQNELIDILRDYYHTDLCFDTDGNLVEHYQSLKQGCATASFLANVLLYDIDDKLSKLNGYYVRYSDDICFIGKDYELAMAILVSELTKIGLHLNPKKVEYLNRDTYFKFLGFSIKGDCISMSKGRLKTFQKEIDKRTIKANGGRGCSYDKAINQVNNYLYKGNGEYSWSSQVLPIINVEEDIDMMNRFIMDRLRACITGKRKLPGLGYKPIGMVGVVDYPHQGNVGNNLRITPKELDRYMSLECMRKALLTSREAYDVLIMQM